MTMVMASGGNPEEQQLVPGQLVSVSSPSAVSCQSASRPGIAGGGRN